MKNRVRLYVLLFMIVLIGAIVPFAAQFVLPFFFPEENVAGAEVWNQYVGIILGIVATITSVVSLVLGFRSEAQSNATELRTRDLLHKIETRVEILLQRQEQMQNSLIGDYSESKKVVSTKLASGTSERCDEVVN